MFNAPARPCPIPAMTEPRLVRWTLIGAALLFLGLFLFVPLATVFARAFEKGFAAYAAAIRDGDTLAAVRLTLAAAIISVCLNLIFGLAAAWTIGKFDFFGKKTTPTDRVLIGAKTTVLGREVQLYNVHLLAFFMLGSSSTLNPFQRNMVAEQLAAAKGPTVLTGDFNVSKHHTLIEQFGACGFSTVQQTAITWRRRPYVLDHAFHNAQLRCVGHKVEPTPASDHHVLVADFEFV